MAAVAHRCQPAPDRARRDQSQFWATTGLYPQVLIVGTLDNTVENVQQIQITCTDGARHRAWLPRRLRLTHGAARRTSRSEEIASREMRGAIPIKPAGSLGDSA